jgi:molybdopterin synthase catalytic subunit
MRPRSSHPSAAVAETRISVFKIVDGPIEKIALEDAVRTDADGAVIVFRGVARRFSRGRDVVHLEYEAYPEMAEKVMAEIGDEMKTRWPITEVAIVHRTGVLEIGQASVAIAVSAPHRGEAFAACQYAIDRLKQIVPIWKKEVWSDGSQWIGWEHEAHSQDAVVDAP